MMKNIKIIGLVLCSIVLVGCEDKSMQIIGTSWETNDTTSLIRSMQFTDDMHVILYTPTFTVTEQINGWYTISSTSSKQIVVTYSFVPDLGAVSEWTIYFNGTSDIYGSNKKEMTFDYTVEGKHEDYIEKFINIGPFKTYNTKFYRK